MVHEVCLESGKVAENCIIHFLGSEFLGPSLQKTTIKSVFVSKQTICI